ncbi:MAG: 30S ribosomal protein S15 [Candidatus Thermoplasmatota archaeon]|nr:30S ribosomal protein S15 [Euryarchaeota archaeon]MBU4032312.1 30S ribosomal protein S15 [Candidatus Thermoplasmatota archaeon]MBU4071105.1 30S ribosomal protein S15 [Candidatus Thermoplasmatota archaeon]MBU4143651.1 30S ribosomal protein S15 [Candidatus Thermoplasmatota archaeon]MBU4591311.1 30S ribosomal protein S15 [Candidatus Thermoplasmatota archaeon]
MARMHARKKGRSSSKRPFTTENPAWVPLGSTEIENTIVKLANDGSNSALIGLVLRDQYGVPDVKLATGKSITDIMKEKNIMPKLPEDIGALLKKVIGLSTYLKANPRDIHNKRNLHLLEAKIRRLERYYKNTGAIPESWKYSLDRAELELSR